MELSKSFFISALNAVDANIAIIDPAGKILFTNSGWKSFGRENGQKRVDWTECNYLDNLRKAKGDQWAEASLSGIQSVLKGEKDTFELDYPCHSPTQRRWFSIRVLSLPDQKGHAVISHIDISRLKESEEALQSAMAFLEKAQELAHLGYWEWNIPENSITWSDEVYRIFGLTPQEFPATLEAFLHAVHPDDREMAQGKISQTLSSGEPHFSIEHRVMRPDGSIAIVKGLGDIKRKDGEPISMFGTVQDITEVRSVENQLELTEKVLMKSGEGVILTDLKGRIQQANPAFCTIFGFERDEILGKDPKILQSNKHDKGFYDNIWKTVSSEGRWEGEIWNRRKNGEAIPLRLTIFECHDSFGQTNHFIGIYNDLTAIRERDEQLLFSNTHDGLTGLPNRRFFLDYLDNSLKSAAKAGKTVAVLLIDLKRFRRVNDSYGPNRGDEVLQLISQRLESQKTPEATVCRLEGDSFGIVLESDPEGKQAMAGAQMALDAISETISLEESSIRLSASIGIAQFPQDGKDAVTLMGNAGLARNLAHEEGGGQYHFFQEKMSEEAKRRFHLENAMERGLKAEEFILYYQPKLNLKANKITSMEALVRWNRPEHGIVSPVEFIPLAEETGFILQLGSWVLMEACRQIGEWKRAGHELKVAVNLSGMQLADENIVQEVRDAMKINGITPDNLELEITESMLMNDVQKAITTMKAFQNIGISLSIDDFGTGYSSLAYLKDFPIDYLKIDQSFIRDLTPGSDNARIVTAIHNMSMGLRLKTIAEGVETEEQLAFLKELGVDFIQGYFISKPVEASLFLPACHVNHF